MTDDSRLWFADLVAALGLTAASTGALWSGIGGPARLAFALPLLLFLPGYGFVSVLFPRDGERPIRLASFDERTNTGSQGRSIVTTPSLLGRVALASVASVAVVPMAILALDLSPWPLAAEPILLTVSGATAGLLVLALVSRLLVGRGDRFAVRAGDLPVPGYSVAGTHRFSRTRWDARVPNLLLAVGAVLLLTSVGYAAVSPPSPDGFTEFRAETENMTIDTQSLYPDRLAPGETTTVETVVTNQEGTQQRYTLVALLQEVERSDRDVTVTSSSVVGRADATLADGERRRVPVDVRPSTTAEDQRLVLLLYRDGAPADPSMETAYRSLRLDVDVTGGSASLVAPGGALPGQH